MKQQLLTVDSNTKIADNVYSMILTGADTTGTLPGQFINIRLDGLYLRRPISVCDAGEGYYRIVYKTVGVGTEAMSELGRGARLDTLTGLGNGFHTEKSGKKPLLIGGGVGVPPLYLLAKRLTAEKKSVSAVLGFGKAGDIILEEELRKLGVSVFIATAASPDRAGVKKGFVTDLLPEIPDPSFFYACGPEPMLKAVYDKTECDGELSFEERMGCGFGACMGCSCKTKYGNKRICKDGPVLEKEEVIW